MPESLNPENEHSQPDPQEADRTRQLSIFATYLWCERGVVRSIIASTAYASREFPVVLTPEELANLFFYNKATRPPVPPSRYKSVNYTPNPEPPTPEEVANTMEYNRATRPAISPSRYSHVGYMPNPEPPVPPEEVAEHMARLLPLDEVEHPDTDKPR